MLLHIWENDFWCKEEMKNGNVGSKRFTRILRCNPGLKGNFLSVVNQGEVIALIGANGAGKTTTLQTLTGLLSAKEGSVVFEGKDITKVPAHKIVEDGNVHMFRRERSVFADLSVYENLIMGAYTRKDKAEIQESLDGVYKRFPRLEERKGQRAGTLSGGEQQMLAMGRALMS